MFYVTGATWRGQQIRVPAQLRDDALDCAAQLRLDGYINVHVVKEAAR